ncbi:hypothetical protein [Larkinella knui]|uniref:Uncharacterized protein n=1 Tax=Larkinella knui TaxID=2025310 RepID=A0A3P1CJH9_9BACT|nr:hypothetical protein [Larkinella knui]RRB13467.1 hypothetical protein EHT87_14430 [Larkinella knui]
MKTLFRKVISFALLVLVSGLPWSCTIQDHQPAQLVTCSCQLFDNSGPTGFYDTRSMNCPGGKYTCKCGDISFRGAIVEFSCN